MVVRTRNHGRLLSVRDGSNRRRDDDPVRTVPAPSTDPCRSFTLLDGVLLGVLVGGGGRRCEIAEREESGFRLLLLLLLTRAVTWAVTCGGDGGDEASSRSITNRL